MFPIDKEGAATDSLEKKSVLILGGGVRLPYGYEVPVRVSRSTAGPGAGLGAAVFAFDGFRVKKSISYDEGEFELVVSDDESLSLTRGGVPFIDSVEIVPVVRHCPEQAFFNLDPRCMYRCAYCTSPHLGAEQDKHLTVSGIMEMIAESMAEREVKAVSVTSGVIGSAEATVDRMVEAVSRVRSEYPDIPIGVEPYVDSEEQIRRLREAGADEIKINIEAATSELFGRVCPDLNYGQIFGMLEAAVRIFGKGKVVSNIIYGLGETDEELCDVMERLCSMGVIPGLRALRINDLNRENVRRAIGIPAPISPQRAIALAEMQKSIMSKHGITTMTGGTMCVECGCCDLVPFRDLR